MPSRSGSLCISYALMTLVVIGIAKVIGGCIFTQVSAVFTQMAKVF